MSASAHISDASSAPVLSIALIDPEDQRRKEVAVALTGFQGTTVKEYSSFPPEDFEDSPHILEHRYDAVIIGLDSDPEYAFDVVESHSSTSRGRRTGRKLFVFAGAKGGCGVTTIASNFSVALAQESGRRTLLIDLGLPLGDAALNLGMVAEYSTANAFQDSSRLDQNFLNSLLARHSSGLFVLASPGEFAAIPPANDAIDKLMAVARKSFDYVVVDAGSRLDLRNTAVFDESATLYLITQVGVSELRNANRLLSQLFYTRGNRLQIVLNRFTPVGLLFDEEQITKALTKPAAWKIPDDYATARRTQNTANPVALQDSPISRVIRQMARTACGLPANPKKKKGFRLWPFARSAREAAEPEER